MKTISNINICYLIPGASPLSIYRIRTVHNVHKKDVLRISVALANLNFLDFDFQISIPTLLPLVLDSCAKPNHCCPDLNSVNSCII